MSVKLDERQLRLLTYYAGLGRFEERINMTEVDELVRLKVLKRLSAGVATTDEGQQIAKDYKLSLGRTMNKWETEKDPHTVRRMNKTMEECGELIIAASRVNNQGQDGVDPSTGTPNRRALIDEMADVRVQIEMNLAMLKLDDEEGRYYYDRMRRKTQEMKDWESLYNE